MSKKRIAKLTAEIATLERYASEAVVRADKLKTERARLMDEEEAREEANKCLAVEYFAWQRRLAVLH